MLGIYSIYCIKVASRVSHTRETIFELFIKKLHLFWLSTGYKHTVSQFVVCNVEYKVNNLTCENKSSKPKIFIDIFLATTFYFGVAYN